ncbi:carbohydrate-binding module family 50 protein [Echria macrotheca]|uniref:Carbohydrate-binding module family 50 protein n=1 Tax=Echria macrotheca TaxID=438768 RepID=A0AAJ0B5S7_9PEZI|nr:carbohydrate-binding module family 50 protein [Echria macrotheca]
MASIRSLSFQLLGFVASSTVFAQQFQDVVMGIAWPGLSESCVTALNTTVPNCPSFLIRVSVDNPRLDEEQLEDLCTTSCRTDLTTVRGTIASACNPTTDVIQLDGVVYPATFVADRFLFTYDLSCRKDSVSNQFCDTIFLTALASGAPPDEDASCSDCALGTMQTQLNSAFGYHADFAAEFASIKASCSKTGYPVTSPAPYALSSSPAPAPSAPSCESPYVVQSGDSCDAIALDLNVPTYAIIRAGSLNPQCSNLQVGQSLCLPSPCTLYRVQYDETCDSILAQHAGLDEISLLNWNPNINSLCSNLAVLAETLICVSPPGGEPGQGTPITTPPPTPTEEPPTAVPKPANGKAESNFPCGKWYTIQAGDYCEAVSIRQGIALQDFYYLNPSIDTGCTNLWLDTAYCVAPVGDINTYASYPYSTSLPYTLTSPTYTTTTFTPTTIVPSLTPVPTLPIAPGSLSSCDAYVEHVPVPPRADQSVQRDVPVLTNNINSCDYAVSVGNIDMDDFLAWNPSLATVDPCYLQPGYRYCSLNHTSFAPPPPVASIPCTTDLTPEPGTDASCSCFAEIYGRDAEYLLCSEMASDNDITLSQLISWNPWVGSASTCDTGLFAGLDPGEKRAVCIGVGGPVPSSSASSSVVVPSSTTSSAPAASSTVVAPPAPTQPGIVDGCSQYHVAVSGDGCWAIATEYGISLEQFYEWNPASKRIPFSNQNPILVLIKNTASPDCGGLWLDYAYCVAV